MSLKVALSPGLRRLGARLHSCAEVVWVERDSLVEADAFVTDGPLDGATLRGVKSGFAFTTQSSFPVIDRGLCEAQGIHHGYAQGADGWAIVQWVIGVLALWEREASRSLFEGKVGIIGRDAASVRLQQTLEMLQVPCVSCDANRAASLRGVLESCHVLTIHTARPQKEAKPLIGAEALRLMRANHPLIINASWGEALESFELLRARDRRWIKGFALDRYEGEPDVPPELIERAFVATPGTAGRSHETERCVEEMALAALHERFGLAIPPQEESEERGRPFISGHDLHSLASPYDIMADAQAFAQRPQGMEELRRSLPLRHDWRGYQLGNATLTRLLAQHV